METGTIRLDSPFYVRRREDDAAERCLAQPWSTVVVAGSQRQGFVLGHDFDPFVTSICFSGHDAPHSVIP